MILAYLLFGLFLSVLLLEEVAQNLSIMYPDRYKNNTNIRIIIVGVITIMWPLIFINYIKGNL